MMGDSHGFPMRCDYNRIGPGPAGSRGPSADLCLSHPGSRFSIGAQIRVQDKADISLNMTSTSNAVMRPQVWDPQAEHPDARGMYSA